MKCTNCLKDSETGICRECEIYWLAKRYVENETGKYKKFIEICVVSSAAMWIWVIYKLIFWIPNWFDMFQKWFHKLIIY